MEALREQENRGAEIRGGVHCSPHSCCETGEQGSNSASVCRRLLSHGTIVRQSLHERDSRDGRSCTGLICVMDANGVVSAPPYEDSPIEAMKLCSVAMTGLPGTAGDS